MKRGVFVFLFVVAICLLPMALAPPVQASGTMVKIDHATITADPAAPPGLYDPAASLAIEAREMYANLSALNYQKTRGVWDLSPTQPRSRSLEVSYTLKFGEELMGNKGNTTKIQ